MPRRKTLNDLIKGEKVYYCRKCQGIGTETKFYNATNPMIDTNGKMSICKDCCNEIYDTYFSIYNDLEKSILLTCEDLDIRFSKGAIDYTRSHLENVLARNGKLDKVFGIYKSKLQSLKQENDQLTAFRFKDSESNERSDVVIDKKPDELIDPDLQLFWGKKFNSEDLKYLELELSNWKATHKCDNHAELILIKELCIKQLEIMRERDAGKPTTNYIDELQKLMKTASVDPAKANVASAGKSHEAWGLHVKDVESLTPAEWWEQQEKYKDMDGFASYIENYIYRPIVNFLANRRHFGIDGNIDNDDSENDTIEIEPESGDL